MDYSLIGSSARKSSIHLGEDGLKERERQVTRYLEGFGKPLGGASQSRSTRGIVRRAFRWGVEAKFGGPSRNSDERSSL